jgi:16S rRNA (guanine(966)-N(2))-methyltransferase RsmD
MRIIGGELSGRKLRAPRGQATRPTSDRVREAIFNILGPPAHDAHVLDLYAGAGGLGLEALSRGAAQATFVDHAALAARCLAANAEALGYGARACVVRASARTALGRLHQGGQRFAWIFVDPPYASTEAEETLEALGGACGELLVEGGVVVVEHAHRRPLGERHGRLSCSDRRRYGDTDVSFFRRGP